MLENTELLSFGFIALVVATIVWLNATIKAGKYQVVGILLWVGLLSVLSFLDWFKEFDTLPPRLLLAILPPLVFSIVFPFTKLGRKTVATVDIERLTLLHSLRIIVELVFLYQLANIGYASDIVTLHGRNFDIIPAITVLIVWWLFFQKKVLSRRLFLLWNVLSLSVILFTISQGILSSPLPFQQFGFEQPTIAIFYFPFVLLPGFVAPVMIFAHIVFFHWYSYSKVAP